MRAEGAWRSPWMEAVREIGGEWGLSFRERGDWDWDWVYGRVKGNWEKGIRF